MDSRPVVELDGGNLSVGDIVAIGIGDKQVALSADAVQRCRESRAYLEEEVAAERIIYGVNTSFGPMCNKIISGDEIQALQVNLIKSHAAGLGARMLAVCVERGITWRVARTWQGDRNFERWLKRKKGAAWFCPLCAGAKALNRAKEKV